MTLTEIQESFYSRTFEVDAASTWLWGLGVVIALLTTYHTYRYFKARRVRYNPFGSISDQRLIRSIMRTAFDQRRAFEMQVQVDSSSRRPTLRCSPAHLGQDDFSLEINGLKSFSDKWIGRSITIFFRILLNKEFTYYTFPSRIAGIRQPQPDLCHITLLMPTMLENRQKRAFLRITPPRDFFPGAALWCGETLPPPEILNDVSQWARPKLLYLPDRMEQFFLLDLSAGGARIRIPGDVARKFRLQFNASEHTVLMLDLLDPEQNKRLRFWMECRIQNVWAEHASRDVHLGIQFLSWARAKEADNSTEQSRSGIEWLRPSSSNEVEPIGNWIMRRHLELFRENPFDVA